MFGQMFAYDPTRPLIWGNCKRNARACSHCFTSSGSQSKTLLKKIEIKQAACLRKVHKIASLCDNFCRQLNKGWYLNIGIKWSGKYNAGLKFYQHEAHFCRYWYCPLVARSALNCRLSVLSACNLLNVRSELMLLH